MPNFVIRLSMQLNFLERYFIRCLQIQIFDFVVMYCLLITFHHLAAWPKFVFESQKIS